MRVAIAGAVVFTVAACAQTPAPQVFPDGVVNAASFASKQQVAPGSLVAIFGTNLSATLAIADSVPLSNSLANVSVTFNGVPAPILAVVPDTSQHSSQVNAQVPWNVLPNTVTSGVVSMVVTVNGVSSNSSPVPIGASAPGIFSLQFGAGQAAATTGDGAAFIAPVGSIPGAQCRPAKRGDVIVIYATGLGATDFALQDGNIPPPGRLVKTVSVPRVLFGGVAADQVQFSGMSPQFVGLNQLNVVVPQGAPAGNTVPLQLDLGGILTTDKVTVAIAQ
jgi:uncharacterized protein (TIGR03437 family)